MSIGKVYGKATNHILTGGINLTSGNIHCSLHTDTYAPNQDTHEFQSDLTNEVVGTGYTAGGVVVSGVTLTYDAGTNTLMVDCTDPLWTTATLTAVQYAVFYDATSGVAATNPLICYMDFVTPQSATASNFSVVIPITGLLTATVA